MFRRHKSASSSAPEAGTDSAGGKGHPTPKRREAEAAARARAKTPRTRKEIAAAQREQRAKASQRMRTAMSTGEDRYLPARDKGPVRRFIRDFVDVRLRLAELLLPVLLVVLVLGYSGNQQLAAAGNAVMMASLLMVLVDMVILRFQLRRQLAARFPDEPVKGTTYYAVTRALQMKFLRQPKAQVRYGESLPERYR